MDCVFYKRLQGKVRQGPLLQFTGCRQRKLRTALIAKLLNGDVTACQLYICCRGRILARAEGGTENVAQTDDHLTGIFPVACFDQPVQRSEGVV